MNSKNRALQCLDYLRNNQNLADDTIGKVRFILELIAHRRYDEAELAILKYCEPVNLKPTPKNLPLIESKERLAKELEKLGSLFPAFLQIEDSPKR